MYSSYKTHLIDSEYPNTKAINKKNMAGAGAKLRAILFIGSVRENRYGLRVAKFVQAQMEKRDFTVDVFDPLEMKFEMLTKPVHFYGPERKGCPAWLVDCEKRIKEADCFVIVSCEYNHNAPPALLNMLDHFPGSAYGYKPSGIVSYSPGPFGGMRAAMALRPVLGEIGCISVSNIFGIPKVGEALDDTGKPLNDHMESGASKLLTQLSWMGWAMKNHRDAVGTPN